MRHICPVCGSGHIKTDWEATDDNQNWWYTGHYVCLKCLTIYRASGSIRMGEPVVHAWHPACSRHGTDAVVVSEQDNQHFYCVKCGRKMEVRNSRVVMTWQPQVITPAQTEHLSSPKISEEPEADGFHIYEGSLVAVDGVPVEGGGVA